MMTLIITKSLIYRLIGPFYCRLIVLILLSVLSGCSTYIASKQQDLLPQIDAWSVENEYTKALQTLEYVKPTHPQYKELLASRKSLKTKAQEYELKIHNKILNFIKEKRWAEALDLMDQAVAKYPQGEGIKKTQQILLDEQKIQLLSIDQDIMLERSQWMIRTLPLIESRYNTDPRNNKLKTYLLELHKESELLAQKQTLLSRQAIARGHFKTASTHINQAIALAPDTERNNILSSLKNKEKKTSIEKKQAQKLTHKKQQNTILLDIEKSFNSGNLLKTKRLISNLDKNERQNPKLIQLQNDLDLSINNTIQHLLSDANKLYTDGQFKKAIVLWKEALVYDPLNPLAKENIQRAEKVIDKLSTLREKQKE